MTKEYVYDIQGVISVKANDRTDADIAVREETSIEDLAFLLKDTEEQIVSVEFITKEIHHHLSVACDVSGDADIFELGSSSGFQKRKGVMGRIVLDGGVTIVVLSHEESKE